MSGFRWALRIFWLRLTARWRKPPALPCCPCGAYMINDTWCGNGHALTQFGRRSMR